MSVPTTQEEADFLVALEARDCERMRTHLSLWPQWVHAVRPSRQPTVHYLLQHGQSLGQGNASTIACLELLLAHGAELDVFDEAGNSVFHSALCARPNGGFADDCAVVLEYLLCHPQRPSYHSVNYLNLTAVAYACRVGNVPAIDALLATTMTERPLLGKQAAEDAGWEAPFVNLPIGLIMGAERLAGPFAFRFRELTRIAAKQGNGRVLEFLFSLRFPARVIERLALLEGSMRAADKMSRFPDVPVALWDVFPLATDPEDEWSRLGSPLQVACGAFSASSADGDKILDTVAFMIEYTRRHHITVEEEEAEALRVQERYHGHVAPQTPSAVFSLLRAQDAAGRCSMHFAADGRVDGSAKLMSLLYAVDPSILQATDRGGRTPLDAALRGKREANAKWLVAQHGVQSLGGSTRVRGSGIR